MIAPHLPHRLRTSPGVLLCIGMLLVGLLCSACPVAAATPPLPLADYWRQLSEMRARVAGLAAASEARVKQELASEADRWEAIEAVLLNDDVVVPVDHSYLVGLMRADSPDLAQIGAALTHLQEALPTAKSAVDPDRAQQILTGILAQPEFQWAERERTPLERWWQEFRERLWEWLQRLLGDRGGVVVGGGSKALGYLVLFAGILGIGLLAYYLLRGLRLHFVSDAELNMQNGVRGAPLTASAALERAQSLSTGGDYRTAMRYLYLSLLLLLDEREILRYDHTLTNREYARSLTRLPQFAATFNRVVDVFDRVWYGHHDLNADEYADYATQVKDLEQTHEDKVA